MNPYYRHCPDPFDPDNHDGGYIAVSKADAIDLVNATRDVPNDPAAQALLNKLNNTPE